MAAIFLRTLILYITLTAVMRFMGKRQIGELQLPEFVAAVSVVVAEECGTDVSRIRIHKIEKVG